MSPRESLLAVAVSPGNAENRIRIMNPLSGDVAREWRGRADWGLFFSADGEKLLGLYRNQGRTDFVVWRVADGQQLATATGPKDDWPFLSTWAVTADLTLGAHRLGDAGLQLIDLKTGETRWSVKAADESLWAIALSPDGAILASTGSGLESSIRLWDTAIGREIGRLEGHRTFVPSQLFWPDGKTLASGGADQTIRLWDVSSRRLLRTLRGHTDEVWSLALRPDQTLVSGAKDGAILAWDLRPPRAPAHVTLPRPLKSWRFAADSQSILSVDATGDVVRWRGREFDETEVVMNVGADMAVADWVLRLVQDGALIAIDTNAGNRIQVWNLEKPELLRTMVISAPSSWARPVAFLAGGEKLLLTAITANAASTDPAAFQRALISRDPAGRGLQEWSVTTGEMIRSWPTAEPWGGVLHELPNGQKQCLIRCMDGTVSLIDLNTGEQRTFQLDGRTVGASDLSPDGRLFAAPNPLGWVGVWETRTFQRVATLSGFAPGIYSATFSPDGRRLVAGGDAGEAIRFWDVDGWEPVLTLSTPGHRFESTAFSPGGNVLGSKTYARELHLWRAPSWAEIEAAEVFAARKPDGPGNP